MKSELERKTYNTLKGVMFKEKTKDDYTSELVNIAEEFAIEFAEWCANRYVKLHSVWCPIFGDQRDKNNWKTSKELLDQFKKEKDEQK
jgi:hypothetical protein